MAKILIVDDLKEYLDSLARALAREHEVMKASTLNEAMRVIDDSVELAIVDVRLSEDDVANRDGIAFLRWLREWHPHIPVIMMSAYQDFSSAVDALNLGSAHFLRKPINLEELREALGQLLKRET